MLCCAGWTFLVYKVSGEKGGFEDSSSFEVVLVGGIGSLLEVFPGDLSATARVPHLGVSPCANRCFVFSVFCKSMLSSSEQEIILNTSSYSSLSVSSD